MSPTKTNTIDFQQTAVTAESFPDRYESYLWGLNIYPRLNEVCGYLHEEVSKLQHSPSASAVEEIRINIYLLACAISDSVDDYLAGHSYDFGKVTGALPLAAPLTGVLAKMLLLPDHWRRKGLKKLTEWRDEWEIAVVEYIRAALFGNGKAALDVGVTAKRLVSLCNSSGFPFDRRSKAPAAYRSQDLTHFDAAQLGSQLGTEIADKSRHILIVGCRTAGSYFAPVARARLALDGFENVDSVTIRPKNPLSAKELASVKRASASGALVALIDEPINTGSTLIKAIQALQKAGIKKSNIVVLLPIHPNRKDWDDTADAAALSTIRMILLKPEDWYKPRLLDTEFIARTLQATAPQIFSRIESVKLAEHECAWLDSTSEQKFHSRLKKVFQVEARDASGKPVSRLVLAKSTGWGWYSYAAFLAGERLAGKVPGVYGLRDGILLTEWKQHREDARAISNNHKAFSKTAASYISARVRRLGLANDPVPAMGLANQHKGMEEIAGILSRAYLSKGASFLRRPQVLKQLCQMECPVPTLIDGKMRVSEWVASPRLIKSDFEHHGLGKTELSVTDPAYDLADAILHWRLSPSQELEMIDQYRRETGDSGIEQRLFLYKLLAGHWNMSRMLDNLSDPRLAARHQEFSKEYLNALAFLVEQTTRYCGTRCAPPRSTEVRPPLVFLDIDGVIDQQVFGYPSSTANGMRALSLLNRHGFTTVINSARCTGEAQVYSEAYGCAGAIGEYGSTVWHAATNQKKVLVTLESALQIQKLREALASIPGVYLDDRYEQIIRAFLYERGVTVPVPLSVMRGVLAKTDASRLRLYQTFTDSTIVPREVDKGKGLKAFLELADCPQAETIAVGDSEPDLAMFRVAKASYAPSHISCRAAAKLIGTNVASSSYQTGFLECVRRIVHPDGTNCGKCEHVEPAVSNGDLFLEMLSVADQSKMKLLLRSLLDVRSLAAFRR